MSDHERVAVVGAGLVSDSCQATRSRRVLQQVGAMAASFLARRGLHVDLYEMRSDIRLAEHVHGKSINLALSDRGRAALRALGLEQEVLRQHAIPMRARLIHDLSGRRRPIPYGNKDQVCDRHQVTLPVICAPPGHLLSRPTSVERAAADSCRTAAEFAHLLRGEAARHRLR